MGKHKKRVRFYKAENQYPHPQVVRREDRGDYYYSGRRGQEEDWKSRRYDQSPFDRPQGMYLAGGRDFSERLSESDWYGRGSGWNDQNAFVYRGPTPELSRGYKSSARPYREREGFRRRPFWNEVRNFLGVGPKGYRRSDERIREDVCEALARHPEIDASDIEVEVKEGVVTLSGTVPDRWMRRQAEDTVESVSGVQDMRMELRITQSLDNTLGATHGRSFGRRRAI